uniref:Uncharacterized protein n=1 Tax=Oryza nivara TaxID=4536 RepID=A0A0E0J5B3_ORYNI
MGQWGWQDINGRGSKQGSTHIHVLKMIRKVPQTSSAPSAGIDFFCSVVGIDFFRNRLMSHAGGVYIYACKPYEYCLMYMELILVAINNLS